MVINWLKREDSKLRNVRLKDKEEIKDESHSEGAQGKGVIAEESYLNEATLAEDVVPLPHSHKPVSFRFTATSSNLHEQIYLVDTLPVLLSFLLIFGFLHRFSIRYKSGVWVIFSVLLSFYETKSCLGCMYKIIFFFWNPHLFHLQIAQNKNFQLSIIKIIHSSLFQLYIKIKVC